MSMSGRMDSMRTISTLAFAVVVALALTACGINDPADNTNEDFTATLQPSGGNVHEFTAKDSGEFTVKLLALAPNSNLGLSFHVGQTVNVPCDRLKKAANGERLVHADPRSDGCAGLEPGLRAQSTDSEGPLLPAGLRPAPASPGANVYGSRVAPLNGR